MKTIPLICRMAILLIVFNLMTGSYGVVFREPAINKVANKEYDERPYEEVDSSLAAINKIKTEPNDALFEANNIDKVAKSVIFDGSIETVIETEPNDGLSEANDLGTIAGSQLFGGSIEPANDTDFIRIKVAEGQSGKLSIDSDSGVTIVLYAYSEDKKDYFPQATDTHSLSTFVDLGTYYIRIESIDQYNYTLNISIASITCDNEPDDSFAQAIDMGALNSSSALIENGCIRTKEDKDYYKFEVPENMNVTIETIAEGHTRINLYDSAKKELDYSDNYDNRASQMEKDLKPGNYYISVDGLNSGITYKISVEGIK